MSTNTNTSQASPQDLPSIFDLYPSFDIRYASITFLSEQDKFSCPIDGDSIGKLL